MGFSMIPSSLTPHLSPGQTAAQKIEVRLQKGLSRSEDSGVVKWGKVCGSPLTNTVSELAD